MATASVTHVLSDGTTIEAAEHNTNYADLVAFLNASVLHKDGSVAATGALDMGTNKITNLAAPTLASDAARKADVDAVDPGVTDHGALDGNEDDDHTQYLLASGTREVAGNLVPNLDDSRDLGSDLKQWRRGYIGSIWDGSGVAAIDLNNRSLLDGPWTITGGANMGSDRITGVLGIQPSALWPHNNANGSVRWMGVGADLAQAHTASSLKFKEQVRAIDYRDELFMRYSPIWFVYRDDFPHKDRYGDTWDTFENPESGRLGLALEEVEELSPRYVTDVDGLGGINYEGMLPDFIAWTISAIQSLTAENDDLKEEVERLRRLA